jgi:hypothetical protein
MSTHTLHRVVTLPTMEPGTRVEVRSRFDASWARGFEVDSVVAGDAEPRYRIRRRSDAAVLPVLFAPDDVREERHRRDDMWWI